jgi:hemoglobin-like flavoprotein
VVLLETSFDKVKPQADALVASFYENLLTDYPAAKPLFEHTDMSKQRNMLKMGLVTVVENLGTGLLTGDSLEKLFGQGFQRLLLKRLKPLSRKGLS